MTGLRICLLLLLGCISQAAQAQNSPTSRPIKSKTPTEADQQAVALATLKGIGFKVVAGPIPDARNGTLRFSPGSKGYVNLQRTRDGVMLIANGVSFGPYEEAQGDSVVWSSDGSTWAAVVLKPFAPAGNPRTLLVNGREVATHTSIKKVVLSRDGKRCAFVGVDQARDELYIDEKCVGSYSSVAEVAFSPDGKTAAWVAAESDPSALKSGGGYDVYVDGERSASHFRWVGGSDHGHEVPQIVFSPDGKHWAVRGQVLGASANGGIAGFAVMADGKMGPTFDDVVYGTVQFTADSKDLLYAAGACQKGHYAVYRNGQPGKEWNYIQPESLKLIKGGKSVVFTGFEGPSANSIAENPVGGRGDWSPGTARCVIDDAVVASPGGGIQQVSDDGEHVLVCQAGTTKSPRGEVARSILLDGKRVTELPAAPAELQDLRLHFSPNAAHWFVLIVDRFNTKPYLIVDGVVRRLPAAICVREVSVDNTGSVAMLASVGSEAWNMSSPPWRVPSTRQSATLP